MDNTTHGEHSVGQDDASLTPEEEREADEAVRALLTEPALILELFDRAVERGDPRAQRILRDYLRVVSAHVAKREEWHRTHPRP
jgi:hypothetical protein